MTLDVTILREQLAVTERKVQELGELAVMREACTAALVEQSVERLRLGAELTALTTTQWIKELGARFAVLSAESSTVATQLTRAEGELAVLDQTHKAQMAVLQQQQQAAQAECDALYQTMQDTWQRNGVLAQEALAIHAQAIKATKEASDGRVRAVSEQAKAMHATRQTLERQYQEGRPPTATDRRECQSRVDSDPQILSLRREIASLERKLQAVRAHFQSILSTPAKDQPHADILKFMRSMLAYDFQCDPVMGWNPQ